MGAKVRVFFRNLEKICSQWESWINSTSPQSRDLFPPWNVSEYGLFRWCYSYSTCCWCCRVLQRRAMSDRYIFSLASNPFYLWLLCTIFYEAGQVKLSSESSAGSPVIYSLTVARPWRSFSANPTTKFRNLAKNSAIFLAFRCYVIKSRFWN
jgi:hypothetical protein